MIILAILNKPLICNDDIDDGVNLCVQLAIVNLFSYHLRIVVYNTFFQPFHICQLDFDIDNSARF